MSSPSRSVTARPHRWWEAVLATWLPPTCPLTHERLPPGAVLAPRLLDAIALDVTAIDESGIGAIFAYGGPLADLVRQAKFHPDESAARTLVRLWAKDAAQHVKARGATPQAVAYVPASWRRRAARGFDLPALLAQGLAKELALPVFHGVTCERHLPPLSKGATKEARIAANVGRFSCAPAPTHLVLVDDVVTSGATMGAVKALLETQNATVVAVALARSDRDQVLVD